MHITPLRSYRATLIPPHGGCSRLAGQAAPTLPTIRLKASNADRAQAAAQHVTGLPVLHVELVSSGARAVA